MTMSKISNIANASDGGSVIKMDIDDAHELHERITDNQANWLTDETFLRNL